MANAKWQMAFSSLLVEARRKKNKKKFFNFAGLILTTIYLDTFKIEIVNINNNTQNLDFRFHFALKLNLVRILIYCIYAI